MSPAFACIADQIDTGTECVDTKFSVTTTNLAANKEVKFYMSAKGTFYVDCGDGVAISGTGASGNTITRNDTTEALYSCAYTNGGVKTIKFAGRATEYNGSGSNVSSSAAIRFGYYNTADNSTPGLVAGVAGSISAVFPSLSKNSDGITIHPRFVDTFARTRITSIPPESFNNVVGYTGMFYRTFNYCIYLTSIPANLFSNITKSKAYLFYGTFWHCSGITSIPENLFANMIGNEAMFEYTFSGTGIRSIPKNLFANIRVSGYAEFAQTFQACTNLTKIPEGLFRGITTATSTMFHTTFNNCTNLSGYIPASAFSGLIANGCPTATYMWTNTFEGTQLSTTPTCPPSYKVLVTDYDTLWGGRTVCELPIPKIVTTSYVQGFYDEIDATKQDRLESGVNVITTGAPDGMVVSITADHGIVRVHKEEIQIPVGSVENPTNWLPIWVE